jgi:hypothetical protein
MKKSDDQDIFEMLDQLDEETKADIIHDVEMHEEMKLERKDLDKIKQKTFQKIGIVQMERPKRPLFTGKRMIAASILGLVILSSAIFNTEVLGALQKALQFIPGIGIVKEEDVPRERYILQHPVKVPIGGGSIEITGMMVDEEITQIIMSGTVARPGSIHLINELGTKYNIKSSHVSSSSRLWSGTFWYQGKLDIKEHVTIQLGGYSESINIPITLVKAKTFDSYEELGETVTIQDIAITALPSKFENKGRVTIVSRQPKEFWISDYGIRGIYRAPENKKLHVFDDKGKKYDLEKPWGLSAPAREIYFNLQEGVQKYTMIIPEITVRYHDKVELSLNIPMESGMAIVIDQSFEIAGFPVEITKIERLEKNGIRLYMDLNYNEHEDKSLSNFRLDKMSHMAKLHGETGELLDYLEFDVEPNSNKIDITITDPQVVIRGPWIFELPVDQYFTD